MTSELAVRPPSDSALLTKVAHGACPRMGKTPAFPLAKTALLRFSQQRDWISRGLSSNGENLGIPHAQVGERDGAYPHSRTSKLRRFPPQTAPWEPSQCAALGTRPPKVLHRAADRRLSSFYCYYLSIIV